MKEKLWYIESKYFCAGVVSYGDEIFEAAPILAWTVGKRIIWFQRYCKRKGWDIITLDR